MKCNAQLIIGDDFSDNSTTFHCMLDKDHEGKHTERFNHGSAEEIVIVSWDGDDTPCETCEGNCYTYKYGDNIDYDDPDFDEKYKCKDCGGSGRKHNLRG